MITGIQQIHISAKNLLRAVEFYQTVLGLEPLMVLPEQEMAFFDCGGVRLYLGNNPEYASNPFIYYTVTDIENAFSNIKAAGATVIKAPGIIHATETHENWLAAFHDSEGNTLHIMQEKPRAAESKPTD